MDKKEETLTLVDRTKRVKDARAEAQREIDEYRNQKEDEFKKFEAEVCSKNHSRQLKEILDSEPGLYNLMLMILLPTALQRQQEG